MTNNYGPTNQGNIFARLNNFLKSVNPQNPTIEEVPDDDEDSDMVFDEASMMTGAWFFFWNPHPRRIEGFRLGWF